MPVKSTTDIVPPLGLLDEFSNMLSSSDIDDTFPNSEPLLSDDIWKKFEFDFPELSGIEDIFEELDCSKPDCSLFGNIDDSVLRNHDCMWAGHCGSKEHPADEPRTQNNLNCIVPKPPVFVKPQTTAKPTVTSQQSVLKPALRATASMSTVAQHTLQTPPESDDEEKHSTQTKLSKILNEAILEYDIEEDSDLCDYFEDGDVDAKEEPVDIKDESLEVEEEEEQPEEEEKKIRSYMQFAAENDHSYHKDKNTSMMRHTNFGLDTPSDSEEEEIDVVSVGDKLTIPNNNRMVCNLPTNPSSRDRQQLQRRMATAISKRRINNGSSIKTILPIRKQSAESTAKRKTETTRGVKRSRGYRGSNGSAYKKQRLAYGNSCSDSEPEPSEKRSLHNNMERQRRIDLRNAFEGLRLLVPEVSKKERAAKVVILREAAKYCDHLGNVSSNHNRHLDELRRKQEWLRSRVSQMRRNLAAKR